MPHRSKLHDHCIGCCCFQSSPTPRLTFPFFTRDGWLDIPRPKPGTWLEKPGWEERTLFFTKSREILKDEISFEEINNLGERKEVITIQTYQKTFAINIPEDQKTYWEKRTDTIMNRETTLYSLLETTLNELNDKN